jgi:hypothetical protein
VSQRGGSWFCTLTTCPHPLTTRGEERGEEIEAVRITPVKIEDTGAGITRIWDESGTVFEIGNVGEEMAKQLVRIFSRVSKAEGTTGGAEANEWNCDQCTFLNPESNRQCEMCQSTFFKSTPKAPVPMSQPLRSETAGTSVDGEEEEEEGGEEDHSGPIPATAMAADGTVYSLGTVKPSQTVLQVKQLLATLSEMSASNQSLFLIDDARQDLDNLELKNCEMIHEVVTYTPSTTELQFAVMVGMRAGSVVDFVKALPPSAPPQLVLGDGTTAGLNNPVGIATVPGYPDLLVVASRYAHYVRVYHKQSGKVLCSIGRENEPGKAGGEFNRPWGLAVSVDGSHLVVSELNQGRLQVS